MEGSYRGPVRTAAARVGQRVRDGDMLLEQSLCSSDRGYNWAFIQCPGKQRLFLRQTTLTIHSDVEPHTVLHVQLIIRFVCVCVRQRVSVMVTAGVSTGARANAVET